jgi:hypothetical protein
MVKKDLFGSVEVAKNLLDDDKKDVLKHSLDNIQSKVTQNIVSKIKNSKKTKEK